MEAALYYPGNELGTSVDHMWSQRKALLNQDTFTIGFLNQELLLSFGDRFTVTRADGQVFHYHARGGISGMYSTSIHTSVKGRYDAVGIMLKPTGLYRLFGLHAAHLSNRVCSLPELGFDHQCLAQELMHAGNDTDRLRLLEAFLLQVARPHPIPSFIADFLSMIAHEDMQKGGIGNYLEQYGLTRKKHLEAFKQIIGYTPGKYIQLVQVNKAIANMAERPDGKLTEIAYEAGFYDQAHFTRLFKAIAGITPFQYRKAVQEQKVYTAFPNTMFA